MPALLFLFLAAPALLPAAFGSSRNERVVFLVGESEYGSSRTMPTLAAELEERLGRLAGHLIETGEVAGRWPPPHLPT